MGIMDYSKMVLGESPYNLAFETEAVLPPKIVFPTLWVKNFEENPLEGLQANLDHIDEEELWRISTPWYTKKL